MSALPLPTKDCHCATCEWLRANGVDEHGIKTSTFTTVNDKLQCFHLYGLNSGGYCMRCGANVGPSWGTR